MNVVDIFIASYFLVVGLCVGSFINVIVYRWPRGESFVLPSSRCPHCQEKIPFYLNIPVFSWIWLKGRARCCKKKIALEYPLVELLTGLLFLFTYSVFGLSFRCFELCLFIAMALPCFIIDLKHFLLPDIFTFPGMVLGVLGSLFDPGRTPASSIMALILGGGAFWSIAFFYEKVRKKEGMGFGDVKLIAWLGALGGVSSLGFIIFVSSFLGAFIGILLIAFKKGNGDTAIPFGPFLISAAFIYFYFAPQLAPYFQGLFLML